MTKQDWIFFIFILFAVLTIAVGISMMVTDTFNYERWCHEKENGLIIDGRCLTSNMTILNYTDYQEYRKEVKLR